MTEESLWAPDDLSKFLKVPDETIKGWRKARTGPPFMRVCGAVRYSPAAVRAWLAAQTVAPKASAAA